MQFSGTKLYIAVAVKNCYKTLSAHECHYHCYYLQMLMNVKQANKHVTQMPYVLTHLGLLNAPASQVTLVTV